METPHHSQIRGWRGGRPFASGPYELLQIVRRTTGPVTFQIFDHGDGLHSAQSADFFDQTSFILVETPRRGQVLVYAEECLCTTIGCQEMRVNEVSVRPRQEHDASIGHSELRGGV